MLQPCHLPQTTNEKVLKIVHPDSEITIDNNFIDVVQILPNKPVFPIPEKSKSLIYDQELRNIIDTAPPIIQNICQRFTSTDELTMALFSTITLTGSLFGSIKINYHDKINYPALMLLVVFPPASGKGCLSVIRKLISKINAELVEANNDNIRQYKLKYDQYKKGLKTNSLVLPPVKPLMPMISIPGDVTSAKLIEQLSHNGSEQALMIFETEADAFGNSSSNSQHGTQLSTVLRKSFEFETVSQARKTEGELLISETPKLVMVLSGTENQITKIFNSNEDGLFSRFMIVIGNSSPKWMDVRPDSSKGSHESFFESTADYYHQMWKYFIGKDIEVKFTSDQWDRINLFGETNLAINHHFKGELTGSLAKRHANMITRLAATLTITRLYGGNGIHPKVTCADQDFDIALWMAEHSLNWSLEIYKKLPEKRKDSVPAVKLSLLRALPEYFVAKEALSLGNSIKIPKRTLHRYLTSFIESGYLARLNFGNYQKTAMAQLALSQIDEQELQ